MILLSLTTEMNENKPVSYPYEVTIHRQNNEPFGLYIIPAACVIGRIVPNSPAEKCGLNIGDRILAVNQADISTLPQSHIVSIIKDADRDLVLIIGGVY